MITSISCKLDQLMKTKNIQILISCLILASFLLGAYLYPIMPERMASHWDASGSVNGYMSKLWGLFLMPVISTVLFLAFLVIPKIDPLKENIAKFRAYFDLFILLLFGFLFYFICLPYSGTWATGSTSSSSWHRPSACSSFMPES